MRALLGLVTMATLTLTSACSGEDGSGTAGPGAGGAASGGAGGSGWGGSSEWPDAGSDSGWPGTGGAAGGASGGSAGTGGGSAGTGGGSAGTGGAAGSGGAGGGGGGDPYANPICNGNMSGLYCGKSEMTGADPDVLYHCSGVVGTPPDSATPCPEGCVAEVHGKADHCAVATSPDSYKLPWRAGTSMQLTQDCNDSCCADHVGAAGYAWDFANGTSFTIVAARGGTITHLKDNSTTGCGTKSCVDDANYLVIDHGDGTQSVYLHLLGNSLEPGVTCGATVTQGQALARAGTTGWSTGLHLHFQVSKVHPGAATCECGASGMGCSASSVAWGSFWSSSSYPTVAVDFVEWQGSACGNRRGALPASQN